MRARLTKTQALGSSGLGKSSVEGRERPGAEQTQDWKSAFDNFEKLLGLAMLNLSPWRHLLLVVHFFNDTQKRDVLENAGKKDVNIPSHVRVEVGEMNERRVCEGMQSNKNI